MTHRLPPLRRRRRTINLASVVARVHKGVAKIEATIEPFARQWDEWNHRALHADGPLWVALGDSVTQGIGASDPDASYPAKVVRELRARTGEPWRLINLSMSGGRFSDVRDRQLAILDHAGLQPAVVSALIGSNDVIWRRDVEAIVGDASGMLDALPAGTILSRLGRTRRDHRRVAVNEIFDAAHAEGRVRLYRAWDWPTGQGMWAEDNFHPNDRAHDLLAANLLDAFGDHGIA